MAVELRVVGVVTRTTNAAEGDPATARLPDLWSRAVRHPWLAERREAGAAVVAVLTDYESGASGEYTQVVGVRTSSSDDPPEGLVVVAVAAEDRWHARAEGPLPGALVDAWRDVWSRTAAGEIARAFRTDYEVNDDAGVDLYLSVDG